MTEDIRRDEERTDELDLRERSADPAQADDRPVEDRPVEREPVREGDRVRSDEALATDSDAARRDPAEHSATDRAVAAEGAAVADDRDTHRDPTSERRPAPGPGATTEWSGDGLLSSDDRGSYQQRWDDIQVRFIDEPRQCVREADDLVGEVTTRISDRFSSARQDMEQRWDGGNEPTTEELRQAVQRYRDFFQRLVAQ